MRKPKLASSKAPGKYTLLPKPSVFSKVAHCNSLCNAEYSTAKGIPLQYIVGGTCQTEPNDAKNTLNNNLGRNPLTFCACWSMWDLRAQPPRGRWRVLDGGLGGGLQRRQVDEDPQRLLHEQHHLALQQHDPRGGLRVQRASDRKSGTKQQNSWDSGDISGTLFLPKNDLRHTKFPYEHPKNASCPLTPPRYRTLTYSGSRPRLLAGTGWPRPIIERSRTRDARSTIWPVGILNEL